MPDAPVTPAAETSILGAAAAATPAVDANAAKPAADLTGAKPAVTDDKGKTAEQGTPPAEVKYDFKTPEGVDLKDTLPKFEAISKELKIAPAEAQKLLDWYVKEGGDKAIAAETAWKATNDGWVKAAEADKEIGGEAFKANIEAAKVAITKFGSKELIDALNMTGMGNHPEMIRFLFKVSKAFKEDNLQGGSPTATSQKKDAAEILFGNSK